MAEGWLEYELNRQMAEKVIQGTGTKLDGLVVPFEKGEPPELLDNDIDDPNTLTACKLKFTGKIEWRKLPNGCEAPFEVWVPENSWWEWRDETEDV